MVFFQWAYAEICFLDQLDFFGTQNLTSIQIQTKLFINPSEENKIRELNN